MIDPGIAVRRDEIPAGSLLGPAPRATALVE
jgi:hypothetical protein